MVSGEPEILEQRGAKKDSNKDDDVQEGKDDEG